MWGSSIVGYGEYHYAYESGREGDMPRIGFSPRSANLVFYIIAGFAQHGGLLEKLGKHRIGKSCLYVNKLSDLDMGVLEEIARRAWREMEKNYPA